MNRKSITPLLSRLTPALLILATPGAFAIDQTVSDPGDSGLSTQLRQRVNSASPGDRIVFAVAQPVVLNPANGAIYIGKNLTVNGGGSVIISGNGGTRIFVIDAGATCTLQNLTISNGYSSSGDGGAIYNSGTLNITGCKLFNNQTAPAYSGGAVLTYGPLNITNSEFGANKAGGGGAVYPRFSPAFTTITGCNFHDNEAINSAFAWGGAILLWDGAEVTVSKSTFVRNKAFYAGDAANGWGGAIRVTANSTFKADNCTFSDNAATRGGGVENDGTTNLSRVTLNNNSASVGGAVQNHAGSANLTNVTISGNSGGYGGGLEIEAGDTSLTNLTFKENSATSGGGVYHYAGSLYLTNTVIAQSLSGGNWYGAAPTGGGYNLSDDNTCGFVTTGGADNVGNLLLGPLAKNGGPTKTHLPQAGSAAIDNGTTNGAPATDQRGVKRPQGIAMDVGAVEVAPTLVENTDPSIQYNGWIGFGSASANGGYYRFSNVANDSITYKFTATSIKWITAKGPNLGKAAVTIDGVSKGTFDLYRSSTLWNQQIIFSGLSNATHTMVIKVTGSKNVSATNYNVVVDAFLVGGATTPVQESAASVQYNSWTGTKQTAASGGSYRASGTLGAVASFQFNGTAVTFITARGPSYGKVNILIDGGSPVSTLDLYAPAQQWKSRINIAGLGDSPHTIEIRPAHTKNASSTGYNVVLDAFAGNFTPPQ